MCCCGCSQCGAIIANILYITQRLATCFALTAVVGTLILTLLVMLAVGVGLGYHYCVVETKTYQLNLHEYQYTPVPGLSTTSQPKTAAATESKTFRRFFENPDFIMPIHANNAEFSQFIAKIRAMKRNVTDLTKRYEETAQNSEWKTRQGEPE